MGDAKKIGKSGDEETSKYRRKNEQKCLGVLYFTVTVYVYYS